MPNSSARSIFCPALDPAITISTFFETPATTMHPNTLALAAACFLVALVKAPVKTIFLPFRSTLLVFFSAMNTDSIEYDDWHETVHNPFIFPNL